VVVAVDGGIRGGGVLGDEQCSSWEYSGAAWRGESCLPCRRFTVRRGNSRSCLALRSSHRPAPSTRESEPQGDRTLEARASNRETARNVHVVACSPLASALIHAHMLKCASCSKGFKTVIARTACVSALAEFRLRL
jgi:hypothetical protein